MNSSPRRTPYFLMSLVAMLAIQTDAMAQSVEDGIRRCVAIENDDDRLRCFDAVAAATMPPPAPAEAEVPASQPAPAATVSEPLSPSDPVAPTIASETPPPPAATETAIESSPQPAAAPPPAEPVAATSETAASEIEPISDEIGSSSIAGRERPEAQKYSARVIKCQESKQSRQYYFFFENGQVWKQANYQRIRWRDCEFDVTVSRGKLGFDMYVPDKERTVRVKRIR